MPRRHRRHAAWRALAGLSLLGFATATLWPLAEPPGEAGPGAGFSLADALRNLLLLAPFGLAAGALGVRALQVAAVAAALAVAVELAQVAIPGRDPNLIDVVANALGAGFAARLAARASRWLRPSRARAGAVVAGLALVALATGPLLEPWPAPGPWYAHLDPELAHLETYAGSVEAATIDDLPLHHGAVSDSDALRARMTDGFDLRVSGRAGAAPTRQSAFLLLTDARGKSQLLFGPRGDDLVLRHRAGGTALGLEGVRVVAAGALAGLEPGGAFEVEARVAEGDVCLGAQGRRWCGLGVGLGDGWQLLAPDRAVFDGVRPALRGLLLGLLALPLGLFAPPGRSRVAFWALGLGALVGLPILAGLQPAPLVAGLGAGLGLLAGAALARCVSTAKLRA